MEDHLRAVFMAVLVEVIDPMRIKCTGPTNDAVDLISFFHQQFREIGTVLTCNSGYQSLLHHVCPFTLIDSSALRNGLASETLS